MELKRVFKNDNDELRAGWQILIFLVLLAIATAAAVVPFVLTKNTDMFLTSLAALIGALIATFLVLRFVHHKPFSTVGLLPDKQGMRQFGIGCLAGYLMMTAIFGFEYLLGYVTVVAADLDGIAMLKTFGFAVVFFGVAALYEEILFRGYPFQTLVRGIGFVPAVIVAGILFSAAHLRNPNASAFGLINIVLVSIVFSLAYWRTRSLWLPFGIHFAWNLSQTTFYGFPTSGVHFTQRELTRLTQFGPEWLTGGSFGPEGGAFATLAIVLCGLFVYYSETLRPSENQTVLERENEYLTAQIFDQRFRRERKAA